MKRLVILFLIIAIPSYAYGADITDNISISGTVTSVYQWLRNEKGDLENKERGSIVADMGLSFKPIENGEFFLRGSFARGDGLKDINPFNISPNGDDLYHDLLDINGHERDNLLELWYSHKFQIEKDLSFKTTFGIIDSTAFIDDNSYAGDELGQFMNEALIHNPISNLPSYDMGVACEFEAGRFHFRAVGMNSRNDLDKNYNYFAIQLGYKVEIPAGEGNYRIYGFMTNKRFLNWDEDEYKRLKGIGVSFDQEIIKEKLGAFFRAGWQDDSSRIDYKAMVSLGFNIKGSFWGRKDDEIGVGYAFLKSPSRSELRRGNVFEGYMKFKIFSYKFFSSDITIDYQYMEEKKLGEGERSAHIPGVRWNINF
jgi:porin